MCSQNQINLEQTFKALLIEEFLQNNVQELETRQQQILNKGVIQKEKIKIVIACGLLLLTFLFLGLNFFLHGRKLITFLFFPIHVFEALKFMLILYLLLLFYNFCRVRINKSILKRQLIVSDDLAANKTNLKTVKNMLHHSSIPLKYQNKEALETMLQFIREGKAKSEQEALSLYKQVIK